MFRRCKFVSRRRFWRNENGASAVEFAMILPVLVLLIGGITEGAMMFHIWGNMEHICRQAARSVAIGEMTDAQASTFVANKFQTSFGAFDVEPTITLGTDVVVEVSIPASQLVDLQPFGLFRSLTLATRVTMRREAK